MKASNKRRHEESDSSSSSGLGQKLLSLVRSAKDSPSDTISEAFAEAIRAVSIKGLLHGNQNVADQIMSRREGNKGKKRTKKSQKQQQQSDDGRPTLDAQLVLQACMRGLEQHDSPWLVDLSADLITAMLEYMQNNYSTTTVLFLAEFELLAEVAKPIITALLPSASTKATRRTAMRLMTLTPHRWKRSQDLVTQLREAAVQAHDARLLAALAMVASVETPAAQVWSLYVDSTVTTIQFLLHRVFGRKESDSPTFPKVWTTAVEQTWIPTLLDTEVSEEANARTFIGYIEFLVGVLQSTLARDSLGIGAAATTPVLQQLMDARIDVISLLSVCESLLSFPSTADGLWKGTKKRLRKEVVDQGFRLSPATLVGEISTTIVRLGHSLLDTVHRCLGETVLLPFSHQLFQHCYRALLVTTPLPLRSIVDPVVRVGSQRIRPERTEASLQATSFASLGRVITTVGMDTTQESATHAVTLACGHIVQQQSDDPRTTSWTQRRIVVGAALEFLVVCLTCEGAMLPARDLIDSTAFTCCVSGHNAIWSDEQLYHQLLDFAMAVLRTPHKNGAACDASLGREIQRLVQRRGSSGWKSVATIQMCEMLMAPRLPALVVVTANQTTSAESAESLWSQIEKARTDLLEQTQSPAQVDLPAITQVPKSKPQIVEEGIRPVPLAPPMKHGDNNKVEPPAHSTSTAVAASVVVDEGGNGTQNTMHEEENDGDDDDLPMIVDCGPDEEDAES